MSSAVPLQTGNDQEQDLVAMWTGAYLADYKPRSTPSRKKSGTGESTTVAFGRTTKRDDQTLQDDASPTSSRIIEEQSSQHTATRKQKQPLHVVGNGGDEASVSSGQREHRLSSGQDSKHKGRQMFASPGGGLDLAKAQEKRKRQMSYSREIRHASKGNSISLQIDSITRVVVQSFRKLINCERCALFLMDHSRNQLYFKPVGDADGSSSSSCCRVIRFPASAGVAGWVATNKTMLNIKNAYEDHRFNKEIDKQTNFRTRTILCVPVITSRGGRLVGVIQMVNKMMGDGKSLQEKAKKKKSDEKNQPGYLEIYEAFDRADETTLERCAAQVSGALEEILVSSRSLPNKDAPPQDGSTSSASDSASPVQKSNSTAVLTINRTARRDSSRRRSSIGNLAQFVSTQAGKMTKDNTPKEAAFGKAASVSEALMRFQFRNAAGPQMSARGDADIAEAASKRKRMEEYTRQRAKLLQ